MALEEPVATVVPAA